MVQRSSNDKTPLILLVFASFATPDDRVAFEDLLRTARVVLQDATCRTLAYATRYTPTFVQTWIKDQLRAWNGPVALFYWAGKDDLLSASSKIGTLDQFIPSLREARKILVVDDALLRQPHVVTRYPTVDVNGGYVDKPLFLLRTGPPYTLDTARELGNYLGTRDRPRAPTDTLLAVSSSPTAYARSDATVPVRRATTVSEASRLRAIPDPRAVNEDDRETIPPAPPTPPSRPR